MSKTSMPQFPKLKSWNYPCPQHRQVFADISEEVIFAVRDFQRSLEELGTHIPLLLNGKQVSSFSPGASSFPIHHPQQLPL